MDEHLPASHLSISQVNPYIIDSCRGEVYAVYFRKDFKSLLFLRIIMVISRSILCQGQNQRLYYYDFNCISVMFSVIDAGSMSSK